MTAPTYSRETRSAIRAFLRHCTLPLIYENESFVQIVGTATLFCISDATFLITASHIFDDYEVSSVGVPNAPDGPGAATLGQLMMHRVKSHDVDVAVLRLSNDEVRKTLGTNWRILGPEDVALSGTAGETRYIIAGCPTYSATVTPGHVHAQWFDMYTSSYDGQTESEKREFDIYLRYPDEIYGANGLTSIQPKLNGVSGAAVWLAGEASGGIWDPQRALKIIGIQVAAVHSKYVVVRSWKLIAQVLSQSGYSLP